MRVRLPHDTLITVGAFSLTNKEITLTVIAAILTLIGYSMNDTIVVFDRIRENLALNRREKLPDVVNRSINQTLSRTVLTSGLTFLTVLSLYLFGGEVLHSSAYRNPLPYKGKRVLVVGAGSSAMEIVHDVATGGAAKAWLAVRTPPNIMLRALPTLANQCAQ